LRGASALRAGLSDPAAVARGIRAADGLERPMSAATRHPPAAGPGRLWNSARRWNI